MMKAIQAFSDTLHVRTGVTSAGQAAWMFVAAAVLSGLRATIDMVMDPLGNPASPFAWVLLLSMVAPAVLGTLTKPGRAQATKAALLVTIAIVAGGSIDVLVWVCLTLAPRVGGAPSLSALAGVAVGMAAVYRATISFRQERALQAAAVMGTLSARSSAGPCVALLSASLLAVSSSSLMVTVASCSSVMICLSFTCALAGGLLLMCTPQPPLSLGSEHRKQQVWSWKLSHLGL